MAHQPLVVPNVPQPQSGLVETVLSGATLNDAGYVPFDPAPTYKYNLNQIDPLYKHRFDSSSMLTWTQDIQTHNLTNTAENMSIYNLIPLLSMHHNTQPTITLEAVKQRMTRANFQVSFSLRTDYDGVDNNFGNTGLNDGIRVRTDWDTSSSNFLTLDINYIQYQLMRKLEGDRSFAPSSDELKAIYKDIHVTLNNNIHLLAIHITPIYIRAETAISKPICDVLLWVGHNNAECIGFSHPLSRNLTQLV